ncbi:MAG: hypothetical protein R3C26_19795 [Calditrichia bacterium]
MTAEMEQPTLALATLFTIQFASAKLDELGHYAQRDDRAQHGRIHCRLSRRCFSLKMHLRWW